MRLSATISRICRCNPWTTTGVTSPFGEVLTFEQDLWSSDQFGVLWAENDCDEDQHKRVEEFNISNLLPHLSDKPHFMTVPRVLAYSNIDPHAFLDKGIIILTIEGWADPAIIEVSYPSAYHQHAGLAKNRFIEHALQNKSHLVFQSFALDRHWGNDVRFNCIKLV